MLGELVPVRHDYGIAAIANSHVFVAGAHYVIGDLRAWGWVTLGLSA